MEYVETPHVASQNQSMRRIHRELAKVRHTIMYPFLALLVIGIALFLVLIQNPGSEGEQILKEWANDPAQNL
jgi:fructose-specific phosphotransferase system IIC component